MILSKDFFFYGTLGLHSLFIFCLQKSEIQKHTVFTIDLYTNIINERNKTKVTKHINYAILILIFFSYIADASHMHRLPLYISASLYLT